MNNAPPKAASIGYATPNPPSALPEFPIWLAVLFQAGHYIFTIAVLVLATGYGQHYKVITKPADLEYTARLVALVSAGPLVLIALAGIIFGIRAGRRPWTAIGLAASALILIAGAMTLYWLPEFQIATRP